MISVYEIMKSMRRQIISFLPDPRTSGEEYQDKLTFLKGKFQMTKGKGNITL